MKYALLILFLLFLSSGQAEPWLSNRFAKNCASCHAPSRYNLPTADRRCTLSCQGCHVNPNGGGLRNEYGKWNSNRWLNSFQKKKKNERPLPWFAQSYAKDSEIIRAKKSIAKRYKGIKDDEIHEKSQLVHKDHAKKFIKSVKKTKEVREKAHPQNVTRLTSDAPDFDFDEMYYLRTNVDDRWNKEAKNLNEFESTIPTDDPYYLSKHNSVNVGLDFRYQGLLSIDSENEDSFWPMTLDIGLQLKPLIEDYSNFSIVVESRYSNGPSNKDIDSAVTTYSSVRTAYFMLDSLPYNTYVMHGIYKPMFENYNPDHTSLAQSILYEGAAYNIKYKATTFGGSPNVPFFNLHYIQPMINESLNQDEGFIINIGGRWVTYGLSLAYSYMDLKDQSTDDQLSKQAHSIQGGVNYKRVTFNSEVLQITDEFEKDGFDEGHILTNEVRYKLWKELYIELISEIANVSPNLKEGSADQMTVGTRFYPYSGVNLSILYRVGNSEEVQADESIDKTEYTEGLIQAHLYF